MKRSWRAGLAPFAIVAVALSGLFAAGGSAQEPPPPSGFRALSGAQAQAFQLPADVRLARTIELPGYGLTLERYQQYLGPAQVLGGQLTL